MILRVASQLVFLDLELKDSSGRSGSVRERRKREEEGKNTVGDYGALGCFNQMHMTNLSLAVRVVSMCFSLCACASCFCTERGALQIVQPKGKSWGKILLFSGGATR